MEESSNSSTENEEFNSEHEVNIILDDKTLNNRFLLQKIEQSKYPIVKLKKFDVNQYLLNHNSFRVTRKVQLAVDEIFLSTHYEEYVNEKISVQYLGSRKGYGVIAIDNIPVNEVICLFLGIIVFKKPRGKSERVIEVVDKWRTYWIDAKRDTESYSAFLNDDHINPNLEVRYIKPSMSKYKYPFFVSSRKILKNEELTYQYPGWNEDYWWRNTLSKYLSLKYNLRKPKLINNGKNLQKILEYHVDNNIKNDDSSFEIVDCNEKGKGVIAKRHFPKDSFLMYYSGDEVDEDKVENDAYVYEIHINNKRKCIDAFHSKCYSRYLNDNDESPNVYVKPIVHSKNGKTYIVFVAKCEIQPGDQLEYDYGGGSRNYDWRKKPKLCHDAKISCETNGSDGQSNNNSESESPITNGNSSAQKFEIDSNECGDHYNILEETSDNNNKHTIEDNVKGNRLCVDYNDNVNNNNNLEEGVYDVNGENASSLLCTTGSKMCDDNINNNIPVSITNTAIPDNKDDHDKNNDAVSGNSYSTTTVQTPNNSKKIMRHLHSLCCNKDIWEMYSYCPKALKCRCISNSFTSKEFVQENKRHICSYSCDFDASVQIRAVDNFRNVLLDLFKLKKSNLIDRSELFKESLKQLFSPGCKEFPWKTFSEESIPLLTFWKNCRSLYKQYLKAQSFIQNSKDVNLVDWISRPLEEFAVCPKFLRYLDVYESMLMKQYPNFIMPFLSNESRVKFLFDILEKHSKDINIIFKNNYNQECIDNINVNKSPFNVLKSINQQVDGHELNIMQIGQLEHNRDETVFNKRFMEVEKWLEEMEEAIELQSCSLDITDTQNKLKRHAQILATVISYQDNIDSFNFFGKLLNENTFEKLNINSKISVLENRYTALRNKVNEKKSLLENSLKALKTLRKLEDEYAWIEENEPFCQISSYGINLKAVSSLIEKHKAFIDELRLHEPVIKEFSSLENLNTPSGIRELLSTKVSILNEKWLLLKSLASQRTVRLHYSKFVHQFYSTASLCENWLNQIEDSEYPHKFNCKVQEIEKYQIHLKSMDTLLDKITSALRKNKDLEKLDICKGFLFSPRKEDAENNPVHSFVIGQENDIDLIKRKCEEVKNRFRRLLGEKTAI